MKKLSIALAAILIAVSMSAASYGPLDISDWSISGVRATSISSLDADIVLSLVNRGPRIVMSGISGVIYNNAGEKFIIGSANDMMIPEGSSRTVLRGHGSLSSYSILLSLLRSPSFNPADYKADISLSLTIGVSKTQEVSKKGVPLSSILGPR